MYEHDKSRLNEQITIRKALLVQLEYVPLPFPGDGFLQLEKTQHQIFTLLFGK
jgi:hypothetical protein